ncbi:hypothetical protein AUJ66_03510 [Candidatus Desantisbacteria bacterium CG1_02_38_46]|uniref:DNA-binding protein n=3 Tax=unclassified Candidatus Desantisiibacteriota TaxID=3106372 RepID=A0A2H9PA70_9BACT|nr:MAG: hypothetical protein AUJ66_03510 [Candidatus Desantisbacteria bacterium CG1_02_38_46]PIU52176.1 MAG: DNA-binding protein [Candidatus Desantisbacteria bacterium CG07_land_8_20_14_0_80_39_15]PIZ15265.1 MAG: DNA-binding protein [Candidatus Desantisbacteria bacterium CG_4_10_14_0_8_um_filter_39_17]
MNNRKKEFNRWFEQAQFDLKAARDSLEATNFEWACFQAQQAGEKTLKGYLSLHGKSDLETRSIFALLKRCSEISPEFKNIEHTKELTQYYIPTRYINGLPDDIPHHFYEKGDAEKCIKHAEQIINLVKEMSRT